MLIDTKPSIKVEKLTGVTANTSFTLPALHAIQSLYVYNNGSNGGTLLIKKVSQIFNTDPAVGSWTFDAPPPESVPVMYSSPETITVESPSWSGMDLDILVVLLDLSI